MPEWIQLTTETGPPISVQVRSIAAFAASRKDPNRSVLYLTTEKNAVYVRESYDEIKRLLGTDR